MHMREWTIVSGMEASACAGFGLRDVHVKTNGCFWSSMNAIHECMRISAAAARRRVEASTRETLISVRHFPPRHSVCTSNLAVVFGVSSVGRVHVKLDRRFRHVCPFLVYRLPRKCCTCQIRPSFSTCSHFSGVSRRYQVFHPLRPPHLVRQMLTVLQIKHPSWVKLQLA